MIKRVNLFDAFRSAMLSNPNASRKEAFEHFLETVKSSPAYLDALASDYFHRMEAQWKTEQVGKSVSLVATPATQRRAEISAERRAESVARAAKADDEVKVRFRAILLLDLTLPNGKRLRDATGAECAKAGGFYTEVSRHLKPTQVVDKHLNEAELRNIQTRFEGGKRRPVGKVEVEHRAGM
jgi:hypothetical protein